MLRKGIFKLFLLKLKNNECMCTETFKNCYNVKNLKCKNDEINYEKVIRFIERQ